MQVGDCDGAGRFGVLDETDEGLLCHECGGRFTHLGVHVYKAHGLTAAAYRQAHGLSRRGLVATDTRAAIAANARKQLAAKPAFLARRDPTAATQAPRRGAISPQGMEAIRRSNQSRRGTRRRGTVVVCAQCGLAFCPLTDVKRRRFCSRSCASRYNRANRSAG